MTDQNGVVTRLFLAQGLCWKFSGNDTYTQTASTRYSNTNRLTVWALMRPDVSTRGDVVTIWGSGADGVSQFNLLYGLTSLKPQFYISSPSATANSGAAATAMRLAQMHTIAGTYDGASVKVYLDGREEASAASTLTLDVTGLAPYRLGNNGALDGDLNGLIALAAVWDRVLSKGELRALHINPWALFRNERRIYLPAAAGGATEVELMASRQLCMNP
jgi:hypothetical protein